MPISGLSAAISAHNDELASSGMRVLALAQREVDPADWDEFLSSGGDPLAMVNDLTLVALVGIVENAVQVCEHGQCIDIRTVAQAAQVQITVEDEGPGIAADMLESLFDPFATSRISGTGLGLAIARNTIRGCRGDITTANRPSGGACFTVSLPSLAHF